MRLKSLSYLLIVFAFLFSNNLKSQELSKERTTKYIFELNAIKQQSQVDGVVSQTKEIEHVQSCELNWLEYRMEILVQEGGSFGIFPMEKLKAILLENKIQLKNFTKEKISQ